MHEMVGNSFSYVFRADGVLGAVIAGAGMVVVGGTVLAVAGAAALVGILTKKKWGDDATQDISQFYPIIQSFVTRQKLYCFTMIRIY